MKKRLSALRALWWRLRYPKGKIWLVNGVPIRVTGRIRQFASVHDPDQWQAILTEIRPDDTVVDCGAGSGIWSLLMGSRLGPQGRLIAIEPDPENFRLLRENVELNQLSSRATLICSALSDSNGEVSFVSSAGPFCRVEEGGGHNSVRCQTLDSLLEPVKAIGVMTMTVQGYEEKALRGARRLFSDANRRPRLLLLAIEPPLWKGTQGTGDLPTLIRLLREYGFDVSSVEKWFANPDHQYLAALLRS